MRDALGPVLAASVQRNIGFTLAVLVTLGLITYVWMLSRSTKREVGSEIELAPNRKVYVDDDELETSVLNRNLFLGLATIGIVAFALPLYWLQAPSQLDGQQAKADRIAVDRGEEDFGPSAEGGRGCADCHGGLEATGGAAPFTVTDANGDFVEIVEWKAPALNTVFQRYDEDEVTDILIYGRDFSPMPAWGVEGGGPLNEQQISNLIAYMRSIQISPEEAREQAQAEVERSLEQGEFETEGEAVFNMGLTSGFAGGAYSCGRCHTQGWSYGQPEVEGGGAYGPNLGNIRSQFPGGAAGFTNHTDFVAAGSMFGITYGKQGQGSGGMPGFGTMLTDEQLRAVVEYERNLER